MTRILTLIYGGESETRLAVTRTLAAMLPGKTAVVSTTALHSAIVQSDENFGEELDLVHVQLRLMVANFLKAGYHVVAEGAFFYDRDGQTFDYDNDIEQLVALMRNLATVSKVVELRGPAETSHKSRFGTRYLTFDTTGRTPAEIATAIRDVLRAEPSG